MAKQHTFKAHPYDREFEYKLLDMYRKMISSETKVMKVMLGDFFVEGYTEIELNAAFQAFKDSEPKTLAPSYFRAFVKNYIERRRITAETEEVNITW